METAILGATLFFVDWISAVLPFELMNVEQGFVPLADEVRTVLAGLFGRSEVEPTKPRWGYAFAWRSRATGVVIQYHPTRVDMGVNVILTGKVLETVSWQTAVSRLLQHGARFTRLDLSMDVVDHDFDLDDLYEQWTTGRTITRATRASRVTSQNGATFYVGARTSEKFLRVYDKGGQQGDAKNERYRIELECKGKAATFVADNILSMGPDAARRCIPAYFDAPEHAGWQRAMRSSEPGIHVPSEKKRPDTEKWLFGVVADSMALMERINPGILDMFYDAVVDKL